MLGRGRSAMSSNRAHAATTARLVALVLLAGGCSTIDVGRAMFEAGQNHRRLQWELEENRPAIDWARPSYEGYRASRAERRNDDG